jgi:threonine dehydratase
LVTASLSPSRRGARRRDEAWKAFAAGCACAKAGRQFFQAIRRVKDAGFARAAPRLIFRRKISP